MEEVLTRETAVAWLDELIETQKRRKEIAVLGKKVEAIVFADSLSIYSGIECLAEALGENLQERQGTGCKFYFFFLQRNRSGAGKGGMIYGGSDDLPSYLRRDAGYRRRGKG